MNQSWGRKAFVSIAGLTVAAMMSACGGGGGGGGGSAKATVTGSVQFPAMSALVQKRTALATSDASVVVEIHTLDGALVTSVNPTSDQTLTEAQRVYSYSVPNLPAGVDYVVKVKRTLQAGGVQVLKKLIEKKEVVEGTVAGQTIDATTTAAVVIASQKLSTTGVKVDLGETLPAGATAAQLSTNIATTVKPALLEESIAAAVNGGKTSLTSSTANYANVFNLVVAAVADTTIGDPSKVMAGTATLTGVPVFDSSAPTVAVFKNFSSSNAGSIVTDTATSYEPPAASASSYVAEAVAYLNAQDIANANLSYQKALSVEPNNVAANVGGALTAGLTLLDDQDFKTMVAKWGVIYPNVTQVVNGTSPIKVPFDNISTIRFKTAAKGASQAKLTPQAAARIIAAFTQLKAKMPQQKVGFKSLRKELGLVPTTAPTVSELQTLIDNVVIPKINKIIAMLAKAEGQAGNSFTITPSMQGNPYATSYTVTDGELYTLDSGLNLLQVLLHFSTAYNFDLPTSYTYNTIAQDPLAYINSPTVFTLKTGGGAKMTLGLQYAKSAAAKAQLAYDAVKTRVAGTGMYDISSWTTLEKVEFQLALTNITNALAGPTNIVIGSTAQTVTVDLTKFFTNPLTRNNLPTFSYDVARDATLSATYGRAVAAVVNGNVVGCDFQPTSDLPDYTLNGIFPANSASSNAAGFNGILPLVSGAVLTGSTDQWPGSATSDGTSIYYVNFSSIGQPIKQINPATGVVSLFATAVEGNYVNGQLLSYGGGFYTIESGYDSSTSSYATMVKPVNVSGGSYTVGTTPTVSVPAASGVYPYVLAAAAQGTNIYYVVSLWDSMAGGQTFQVRKISNLTDDSLLFTFTGHFENLAVSSNYLYLNGTKRSLSAPTTVLGTYVNSSGLLVGGYFYEIWDGKVVKIAGTPSGGTAKIASFF